jgi:beta-glucosidase
MNKWLVIFAIALQICLVPAQVQSAPDGEASVRAKDQLADESAMRTFVDALIKRMTLEEKLGQMNLLTIGCNVTGPVLSEGVEEKIKTGMVGAVLNTTMPAAIRKLQQMAVDNSRLKIPLIFGADVCHGKTTEFPIPLGLAASFDLDLIERTARAAALEASADGLTWTYSPMVDIARDPRWGRVSEGAGEDPYLGSLVAAAMVRGYQENGYSQPNRILSCVKHFALYGAAEAGRDYNTVDMSRVRMFNEYLPPYKGAVDAGVASVMSSFNEIDGIPASANKWLITDLLRRQWGFKGFVVTDYTAVSEMMNHGVGDEKKVAELALNAGIDMDMVSELFIKRGSELVRSGAVRQEAIDASCRRILEAKYRLGLFTDPYRFISEERSKKERMTPDKVALSREAAQKSMVLLKNANQVLPLKPEQKIAFIGPLVKDSRDTASNLSEIWKALESKFGPGKFLYAKGCNLIDDPELIKVLDPGGQTLVPDPKSPAQMITEAVQTAGQSDLVVVVAGESPDQSGEAASRSQIGLPDNQSALLRALKQTGKPIVLVLMNGRPLTLPWEDANMDAILETWFGGTSAGAAIVDTLFGANNPSGKLTMTFPRNVGQIPIYYNHKNTGRPLIKFDEKYCSRYLDVSNEPLYPFGYGLSYTTFDYSNLALSTTTLKPGETLTVSTKVSNTGKYAGVETAQLYIRQLVGSTTRPVRELKGFQKVALNAGESKKVTFKLTDADLRYYNSDLKFVAEPGDFKVFVGTNSRDTREAGFTLVP